MAYVYDGDGYRGGALGLENDFAWRQYMAQREADDYSRGMGMQTPEQIERARQDLSGARAGYEYQMKNGMYNQGEIDAMTSARLQNVNNTTRAMQQNVNAQMSQRGLGGNAGANAALGMAGQFEAAGQRGQVTADIAQQQAQSRERGLDGFAGISKDYANLSTIVTRPDGNGNAYSGIYDKWRNTQVGYDNANWGKKPAAPNIYTAPSGGGQGYSTSVTHYGTPNKKQNYVY